MTAKKKEPRPMRVVQTISIDYELAKQLAAKADKEGVSKISIIEEGLRAVMK